MDADRSRTVRRLATAIAIATALLPAHAAGGPARNAARLDPLMVGQRVLEELNRERAARGLVLVGTSDPLREAAQARAQYVANLPYSQRMNRPERLWTFLEKRGIRGFGEARERLFMLSGYDDPIRQILAEWRAYGEAWSTIMSDKSLLAGIGWAQAADGYGIFLAILVEPLPDLTADQLRHMEERTEQLVNAERRQKGLQDLEPDERLRAIARAHSRDMASRGFFDHVTPDGVHPADRVVNGGLVFLTIAENIARNHGMADPVLAAVRGWMASPGHRENILRDGVHGTGVGIAVGEDGTIFLTQLFFEPPSR